MSTVAFIYEILERSKVIVERTWETDLLDTLTFGELYEKVARENEKHRAIMVSIGFKHPHKEPTQFIKVRISQNLSLLNLQGSNFVRFHLTPEDNNTVEDCPSNENAFSLLMSSAKIKILPSERNLVNNKDNLFNNILSVLQDHGVGFLKGTENSLGKKFVTYLCDLIWYVDTHWKTFKDAVGVKMPDFILAVYKKKTCNESDNVLPYNDYQSKKDPKPRCTQEELSKYVYTGSEYLQTVWLNKKEWDFVGKGLSQLIEGLEKYVKHLKQKTDKMKSMYSSLSPARTPMQDGECYTLEATETLVPSFGFLDEIMVKAAVYDPVFINDIPQFSEMSKYNKYTFLKKLKQLGLTVPLTYFKYSPQSGICTYHFLWKLPETSLRDDSMYIRLSSKVAAEIPVFHTRAMKAEFNDHFKSISKLKPAVIRAMYRYLTNDESASSHKVSKLIDDRVNFALKSEDSEVVFDLRELGTGKAGKYDAFWDALSKVLERDFPPVSEERRHGEQLYLPVAISIKDLIEKVKEVDPDAPVPVESWILLQFTPKDSRRHVALNYTSKFDIVYKIQSRSHHTNHQDTYYCMSLFKMLRSFAVLYRYYTNFFCEDDKHGINIGEPGDPLSSLIRGRKVMVLKGHEPVASDHDWHRFKVTPSVILHCDIPETIEESFYSGQIYTIVKDAIFEKSTALRHVAEKKSVHEESGGHWNPIECMYTDGGPDHNPSHYSVKVSHIAHFLENDLDMLAAACTYPGGSYVDPAERCMPLINISLNGISLCRNRMSEDKEKSISNANSMEQIRQVCEEDEELTEAVKESIKSSLDLIKSRCQRVSLKGKPIIIGEPASTEEIQNVFLNLSKVDTDLLISETTKDKVEKHKDFMKWLSSHSRSRRYIFQLKKCEDSPVDERLVEECVQHIINDSCMDDDIKTTLIICANSSQTCADLSKIVKAVNNKYDNDGVTELRRIISEPHIPCVYCKPPRLPLLTFVDLFWVPDPMPRVDNPEKYQQFAELYRQDTKEVFRPTFVENLDEDVKKLLVKEKVQHTIKCTNCFKPRVVYGDKKVLKENTRSVCLQIETLHYVCGMCLFPDNHNLDKRVVTRRMLKCEDPVEIQFFSSDKFADVCYWCGLGGSFCPIPDNLKEKFKTIYPLCQDCQSNKKKFYTRLPYKRRGGNNTDASKKQKK